MIDERLKKQVEFIIEIDKLKHIYRMNYLMDGSRKENDSEHSWHLAVMAFLLAEHSSTEKLDVLKVMKMVLIHDLVEIDAGDTYCYDEKAHEDKSEREEKAADRLFNILPEDQSKEMRALWEEFEEQASPEAIFAASLDRFQPMLHNYKTKGITWQQNNVTSDKVFNRMSVIEKGSENIWDCVKEIVQDSLDKGYLNK